jgi:hydrogenase maturation protein HypF
MAIKNIIIKGIVQGVGFRPFVYRIAQENRLKGYVKNMGNYVEIVVEGSEISIKSFLDDLKNKKPPLSQINEIKIKDIGHDLVGTYDNFSIEKSEKSPEDEEGTIPPDIAICDDCLKEMMDKNDVRCKYPFIACTNCGPRFTVIEKLPYDRENTSMKEFPLCNDCLKEYENPMDRRFHAQATCCPKCGPKVFLTDKEGNVLSEEDNSINNCTNPSDSLVSHSIRNCTNPSDSLVSHSIRNCTNPSDSLVSHSIRNCTNPSDSLVSHSIRNAVKLLEEGNILAVKGIGGTHLVCAADNDEVVLKLRKRLNRPSQPFAVMSKPEYLEQYAKVDEMELNTLKSPKRPIVVLEKNENYDKYFSKYVSDLNTIGAMLPYSGLHYLLFEDTEKISYIMTSANLPGLPMAIKNEEILKSLNGIADYFLLHNREIVNRCDDSVLKKINNRMVFLRRSRGYAPEPVSVNNNLLIKNNEKNILAVGPELNSVACLVKKNKFYLTQYIGNTSKYETFQYLKDAVNNLISITNTNKIDAIVCDLHPAYNSTKLAYELGEKYGVEVFRAQHHESHAYSLMGDNDIFEDNITIAIDGLGYGRDGNIWGGELLLYKDNKMKRIGHLEEQYQPGGDLATKYPLRMLLSILYKKLDKEELIKFMKRYNFSDKDLKLILFQLDKKLNVSKTTSCGRILDSISALLSVCHEKTYDGEPAIRLESVAENFISSSKNELKKCMDTVENDIKIKNNVLNTTDLVYNCYEMFLEGFSREYIGYYIHMALADGLSKIAIKNADSLGIEYIGLTGGVSYNKLISERIKDNIEKEGFKFLYHSRIPNGDGGISFGQSIGYILNNSDFI